MIDKIFCSRHSQGALLCSFVPGPLEAFGGPGATYYFPFLSVLREICQQFCATSSKFPRYSVNIARKGSGVEVFKGLRGVSCSVY